MQDIQAVGQDPATAVCFRCKQVGHFRVNCPELNRQPQRPRTPEGGYKNQSYGILPLTDLTMVKRGDLNTDLMIHTTVSTGTDVAVGTPTIMGVEAARPITIMVHNHARATDTLWIANSHNLVAIAIQRDHNVVTIVQELAILPTNVHLLEREHLHDPLARRRKLVTIVANSDIWRLNVDPNQDLDLTQKTQKGTINVPQTSKSVRG
jgi:hypothetical protein